jgi:hypothetical protein
MIWVFRVAKREKVILLTSLRNYLMVGLNRGNRSKYAAVRL